LLVAVAATERRGVVAMIGAGKRAAALALCCVGVLGGLAAAPAFAAGTWSAQSSSTTNELIGVSFVDASHGWAVGEGGTIVATSNGGASWGAQTSGTTNPLYGVSFVDASHGWAVGFPGTILATSNGGASWSAQSSGTNILRGVSFVDASHGWAVGDDGTIVATSNGGASWSAQSSGTIDSLRGVSFVDASHGWAVGDFGTIVATSDGGASWSAQSSGTTSFLSGVSFVDRNHGWAVGTSGTILSFVNTPPSGTMTITPSSGPPGTMISATSGTPCPAGSTYATIYLDTGAGTPVTSARATEFDSSGDWAGTLMVPAGTTAGSYFVTAKCFEPAIHGGASDLQNYNFNSFSVTGSTAGTGTVNGRTLNAAGKPLAGVVVTLDSSPTQVTGLSGGYNFASVPAGTHSLSAEHNGRACRVNSVFGKLSPVTITVAAGRTTTVKWVCP
jgi:photosystem II stability/assembly factor-like uncharacterized protein